MVAAEAAAVTHIGVGATDGYRYVGIQPPLTDTEANALAQAGVLDRGNIEQIDGAHACSLLSMYTDLVHPEGANRLAQEKAAEIKNTLVRLGLRSQVEVNKDIVGLMGFRSSPFDPYTDR